MKAAFPPLVVILKSQKKKKKLSERHQVRERFQELITKEQIISNEAVSVPWLGNGVLVLQRQWRQRPDNLYFGRITETR